LQNSLAFEGSERKYVGRRERGGGRSGREGEEEWGGKSQEEGKKQAANWFFFPSLPFLDKGISSLHELFSLLHEPWFWGILSSEEAAQKLLNQKDGTFLVRVSGRLAESAYAITKVRKGSVCRGGGIFSPSSPLLSSPSFFPPSSLLLPLPL
jgi:hypothetical protein